MSFFSTIFNDKFEKKKMIVTGLNHSLKSLYVYNFYVKNDCNILFLCNSLYEANKFFQDISQLTSNVLLFPMDDFLTSEALAASPELLTTRLETLNKLLDNKKYIVVTCLMGYLRYLPSKSTYLSKIRKINKNSLIDIKDLVFFLISIGYDKTGIVSKTGEFAVRGFVIDIFPIGEKYPVRLEFFGDEIESVRYFDSDTQRTINEIDEIIIYPNSEFLTNKNIESNIKYSDLNKYEDVIDIRRFMDNCFLFIDELNDIKLSYERLVQEIYDYNVSLNYDKSYTYMNSLSFPEIYIEFQVFDNDYVYDNKIHYNSHDVELHSNSLETINKELNDYIAQKKTIIISLNDRYQLNKAIDGLNNNFMVITNENEIFNNKVNLIIKKLNYGFCIENFIVISENDLFHKKNNNYRYNSNFKFGKKITDITKLCIGDYVVHRTAGIGRYLGLKTLQQNKLSKDYLMIEYKDGDKLYIPVEKIDLISKFSSNDSIIPKLNKLGSSDWIKTRLKAKKHIESMAKDLLELYAKRKYTKGFSFVNDNEDQIEFEKEFKYQETVDQRKVTEEIKEDMEKPIPMDRLLCADVGYGKTEVAFRAMYKAVLSKKQVAFLCPTTILSTQHYNNAIDRFCSFGVNIALLNRFVSVKKANEIKEKLKQGKVDILIGTHRILGNDIEFFDLGLLVIDEEQRFGVRHKEKIKKYKNSIDVLSLSATPIPRTLQMSMSGIRGLSVIETPPVNRYPVQTYVMAENSHVIKEVIYKEMSRGGQVFILYNYVENMENKLKEIEQLVPDAKVIAAHGRMNKDKIENVIINFINKEYDVLLCTTIIETGIDMPNVNTLIIYDADHFGLAQLYQLRGRVGRSNKIAYCYLMYDKYKILSEVAEKRLNTIKEFTALGSGMDIAMRDLSIRGAGDILGGQQAGFVDSIGIELYLKMLKDEVDKLNGIKKDDEDISERPLLNVATSIDDSYIDDAQLKIQIHKKINEINSYESLNETKNELEDRFGKLSENIIIYMYEELFEKMANSLKITNVKQTNETITITLPNDVSKNINGEILFVEINKISKKFRFGLTNGNLSIILDIKNLEKHFIYYLVKLLEVIKNSSKD